jgi:flagellar hook-associated protein 3 FlgL
VESPTNLRFASQAGLDMQRIMSQLVNLQGQVATQEVATDLAGYGGASGTLINAQSLRASADAKNSALSNLQARFGVQASALDQVSKSAQTLAQSVRSALSSNDGRQLNTELSLAFSSAVSGLNQTWNGQPLFAGERVGNLPVKIGSLDQLVNTAGPQDIFDEAERPQVIDLNGSQVKLADKASDLAQPLMDTFKAMQVMLNSTGGQLPAPMTEDQRNLLLSFAQQLDDEAQTFTVAEGRAGQLQNRFSDEQTRLQQRSDLLSKAIGDQSEPDVGQLSIQINQLMAQYQASAKTFTDISKLSLLNYL